MTFRQDYRALERKFKEQIKQDNETFGWKGQNASYHLPNIEPEGKMDYVLVAMEPSSSARTDDGKKNTPRNFALTIDDFVFHFCVQRCDREDGCAATFR